MAGVSGKGKRQLNIDRGKAADAGFSLVELLIAVTILAIIVIPLLRMFVTSTRINVKSRQTLRATTVAQDIMEGLKAYTLDEVQTQFSLPDGTPSASYFYPTEGFYIVNSSMIQGGVREITELEATDPDDPDDPNYQIYYFGIENLKMQGGEYDALIRLDASTYGFNSAERATGDGRTPGSGAHARDYNGKYYTDVTSVSETNGAGSETDSSYHENIKQNKDLLNYVKKQIEDDPAATSEDLAALDAVTELSFPGPAGIKADEITLLSREIEVVLGEAKEPSGAPAKDAEGNPQCKATIKFKYICEFRGRTYTSYYGVDGFTDDDRGGIPRTFTSGNFYLFYYPVYADTDVDNIVFDIKDEAKLLDKNEPLLKSITLAKQIRSVVDTDNNIIIPDLADADLFANESAYKANVRIKPDVLPGDAKLTFRTNYDMNLSKQARESADPNAVNIHAMPPLSCDPNIDRIDMIGDIVSDKVTNVIYDIEITIYKTGAAQYFAQANDPGFEDREEVVKLASITNID